MTNNVRVNKGSALLRSPPCRRHSPSRAQGEGNASLASIGVTLGSLPTRLESPNGAALTFLGPPLRGLTVIFFITQGCCDELNPYLLEFEMAYSMKSDFVIQEVQILPWVTASPRPGSETRWQEETNVRSRVNQVDRLCMDRLSDFERLRERRCSADGRARFRTLHFPAWRGEPRYDRIRIESRVSLSRMESPLFCRSFISLRATSASV